MACGIHHGQINVPPSRQSHHQTASLKNLQEFLAGGFVALRVVHLRGSGEQLLPLRELGRRTGGRPTSPAHRPAAVPTTTSPVRGG